MLCYTHINIIEKNLSTTKLCMAQDKGEIMPIIIDRSTTIPSCLPDSVNRANLIDITKVNSEWRVFLDIQSGKVHDGAKYYHDSLGLRDNTDEK